MGENKLISNLKIIKEFYNLSNQDMAGDLDISLSYFEKILAGKKEVPQDVLKKIVKRSGVPENDLLYKDLSEDFEKHGGAFEERTSFVEVDATFKELLRGFFERNYPIIDTNLDNESFNMGVRLYKEMLEFLFSEQPIILEDDLSFERIINCFISAYNNGIEESAINALSSMGVYWETLGTQCYPEKFNVNMKVESMWDALKYALDELDEELLKAKRKDFLKKYNSTLTFFMKRLKQTKYADYSYYYLALRYLSGMLDSDITKLSYEEEQKFGLSLMDSLSKMGNEYAVKFFEPLEER